MGESDDDGDYKRRDKFRSERRGGGGGYEEGGGGGGSWGGQRNGGGSQASSQSSWGGRRDGGGRGYGGGGGGGYERRDRYSPSRRGPPPPHDMPPNKRMRGDWDDRGYDSGYRHHGGGGGGYDDYDRGPSASRHASSGYGGRGGGGHHHGGGGHHHSSSHGGGSSGDDGVQPAMMSFKAYLTTQEDSISDEDAIKKYAEYKLEFRRQQLNEFFVGHKDEEWFKMKYHPEDSVKRQEELKSDLLKRVDVFKKFWDLKKFEGVPLDGDRQESIVKILDSTVIILEGGNDNDLKILDEELESKVEEKKEEPKKDDKAASEEPKKEGGDAEGDKPDISEEQLELQKKAKEYLESKGSEGGDDKRGKKRKFGEDSDESSDEEGGAKEDEDLPPGMEKKNGDSEKGKEDGEDSEMKDDKEAEEEKKPEVEAEKEKKVEDDEDEIEEGEDTPKPRALHRTSSIFLRNLAPTITKQEVEAMCKRYQGFLRAAIADPQPERRWFRRGWVTFERNVKIKDICFNLNSTRLRDCELGPIVNRDLTRRIRTVNGITVDKKVVRNDIKLAAKVVTNLDRKWGLWQTPAAEKKEGENGDAVASDETIGLNSTNPVLDNITDYLIEEASAEEEELLGKNNDLEDGEEGEEGTNITRDEELLRVLDRLLFYLRIVHSVDFYNHSEYPNEDEMPNRCGIMHARGTVPTGKVTPVEIEDYCTTFEKKMGSFLQPRPNLTDEEAGKLGMKNEDDEVEKFVLANTQELGKDKWLCPLSGKKFKGPDFVRKHIFNKHGEKVDEVKKEVQYYNSYLRDPKRPQLPENPQNKSGGGGGGGHPGHRMRGAPPRGDSGFPREATSYPVYDHHRGGDRGGGGYDRGYDRGYGGGGRGRRPDYNMGGGRGGGRVTQIARDPRATIDYSDVDFSQDSEYF